MSSLLFSSTDKFYYPRVYCKTRSSLFLQQLKVNTNYLAYSGLRMGEGGGGYNLLEIENNDSVQGTLKW